MASVHNNLESDFVRKLRYEWNLSILKLNGPGLMEPLQTQTGHLGYSWYDRQPNGDGNCPRVSAGAADWYDEGCEGYPGKFVCKKQGV